MDTVLSFQQAVGSGCRAQNRPKVGQVEATALNAPNYSNSHHAELDIGRYELAPHVTTKYRLAAASGGLKNSLVTLLCFVAD